MTDAEIRALRAAAEAVPPVLAELGLEAWADAAMRFRALTQPTVVLALLAEREKLRTALQKIATADFNCATRQKWMAMQACADAALSPRGPRHD